jgi:regulator of cell morphogenesis and NO signaling
MTITELHDRTVGELAAEVPVSIRNFEAWKIDYCCGGMTPLADAVKTAGRTIDEFVDALEKSAVAPAGIRDFSNDTLAGIATHICAAYHRYTREELQTLTPLAEKVNSVHGGRSPFMANVVSLIYDVTADMLPHMLKEEQVLFPYVEQLEAATENGAPAPVPFFGTVKNPVKMMMMEHDRVGELLANLRSVTKNYELPDFACFSYRELYRRLQEFERLTHEHIHVENNIYFPRAIALEEDAGNTTQFGDACGTSCCGGHH